jgi:hypothetical protein
MNRVISEPPQGPAANVSFPSQQNAFVCWVDGFGMHVFYARSS